MSPAAPPSDAIAAFQIGTGVDELGELAMGGGERGGCRPDRGQAGKEAKDSWGGGDGAARGWLDLLGGRGQDLVPTPGKGHQVPQMA